jgi:hypothetical protein
MGLEKYFGAERESNCVAICEGGSFYFLLWGEPGLRWFCGCGCLFFGGFWRWGLVLKFGPDAAVDSSAGFAVWGLIPL